MLAAYIIASVFFLCVLVLVSYCKKVEEIQQRELEQTSQQILSIRSQIAKYTID